MTTKLESLKAFESKSINKMGMKNLIGGNAPNETSAGSRTIYNSCGQAVIHVSYTSDHNMGNGNIDYCGEVATAA